MKDIAVTVLIAALVGVCGCAATNEVGSKAAVRSPVEVLSASRLPAIKEVEKWPNKYGQGLVITTDHYRIYTTLSDTLILRLLPAFMESAYEGYQKELPERIETQNRFDVYLFAERGQWEAFTDDFTGSESVLYKRIQKGAYCDKGTCVAYYIGRNETYTALGHEGWHQFCSRHFTYRLPSWLDEGIATLFETSTYKSAEWGFDPQVNLGRLGGLKRTMLNNNMVPLKRLVGLNPGEVIGGQDSTMAFYSESYALVRFLREEGYGKRLGNYHGVLLGGLRGDWPLPEELRQVAADRNIRLTVRWNAYVGPMLFQHYISSDWEAIQAEYLTFCRKITYRIQLREVAVPVDTSEVH
jgi:hypothetical protein